MVEATGYGEEWDEFEDDGEDQAWNEWELSKANSAVDAIEEE